MMFPPLTMAPVARRPKLPWRLAFEHFSLSSALASLTKTNKPAHTISTTESGFILPSSSLGDSAPSRNLLDTSVADLIYSRVAVPALARSPVAKGVRELAPEPERRERWRSHNCGRVARVVAPAVPS